MSDQGGVGQIAEMQRSGRLLLRHVTRRFDKTLANGASADLMAKDIGLLTNTPEEIALQPDGFGRLARCVDDLSRRAAPANVNTIQLTCAYLKTVEENDPAGENVKARARRLRLIFNLIFGFAAVVTLLSVVILAHVDSGRRSAQLLEKTNKELEIIFADITKVPDSAWIKMNYSDAILTPETHAPGEFGLRYLPFCDGGSKDGKGVYRAPRTSKEGTLAQITCSQYAQAALRQQLVFHRIREWNCSSDAVRSLFFVRCPELGALETESDLQRERWRGTELRTAAVISTLTGFLLPTALGCIGGCAYVLRRLDRKLASFTLDDNDGMHAILRVLLATMLGGLLGVVWSADQQIEIGGFTLSLAAAAFFVGFALELVFSTIEALVEGVAAKVRSA